MTMETCATICAPAVCVQIWERTACAAPAAASLPVRPARIAPCLAMAENFACGRAQISLALRILCSPASFPPLVTSATNPSARTRQQATAHPSSVPPAVHRSTRVCRRELVCTTGAAVTACAEATSSSGSDSADWRICRLAFAPGLDRAGAANARPRPPRKARARVRPE